MRKARSATGTMSFASKLFVLVLVGPAGASGKWCKEEKKKKEK